MNANTCVAVIAIIESARGVENAKEIMTAARLDGIMVGGDDLSADLALFGQYEHPRFREAVESVVDCAMSVGLKVGARLPKTPQERDAMLIACGNDAMVLRSGFQQALEARRDARPEFAERSVPGISSLI